MISRYLIQTALSLTVLLMGVSSCVKAEQEPPGSLLDTLPDIVANVNGVKIARATVAERFEQARSMMAHQQHMENMQHMANMAQPAPRGPQGADQSAAATTTPPTPDAAHPQHMMDDDKSLLRTVINLVVLEQLKLQEVARLGLSVSPEVLNQNIKTIEQQAGSHEALEEQLRQGHTNVDQWRTQLHQALLFQQLADQRRKALPVSDEEIRQYWDQNHSMLSKVWNADRFDQVQGRIRDLIQQARWSAAEGEWHQELVRNAKIWVNPVIRERLAGPSDHTHPGQAATPQTGAASQG